jgi:hypothetical protein
MNTNAFRAGFIKSMKDAGTGDLSQLGKLHTQDYLDGYSAAITHWHGMDGPLVRVARSVGLVDEYDGYYGQGSWDHPSP